MENGNRGVRQKISADDVISKLKDDGDFDRLRLKIIRKLKENEELRYSIVSMVKQSVALNSPGAENMKPRRLSDAIHLEIGGKVNDKISDGLWDIIRSEDGIKSDIRETVESVYNELSRPKWDGNGESSRRDTKRIRNGHGHYRTNTALTDEADGLFDTEPKEPPGFSRTDTCQIDISLAQPKEKIQQPIPLHTLPKEHQQKETLQKSREELGNDALEPSSPPGFPSGKEQKQPCDGSDEDLDAPPGFG